MRKRLFFLIVCFVSGLVTSCQKEWIEIDVDSGNETFEIEEAEYMAIFGDIQYYTISTYINLYQHSVDWLLRKQSEGMKIKCVLHTGDICHQTNALSCWTCFQRAMTVLSMNIPYYSMIGDHDYLWYDGIHIDGRDDTHFNEYVQFPLSMQNVLEQFEEGKMENVVIRNVVQGQRLNLLILEYGPRQEVVEWANKYVRNHSDEHFILMTHEYLEKGGGRRTTGLKSAARLQNTTYTTPEQLWDRLINCNDNIRLVLCGHVGGLYALTIDTNDYGREIPQIQHNIQSPDYRYDNWLMLWEFPAVSDSANVSIYNTKTGKYYDDAAVLFKFKYRDKAVSN